MRLRRKDVEASGASGVLGLGLLLLLAAVLFDAESLYVPGIALLVLGRGLDIGLDKLPGVGFVNSSFALDELKNTHRVPI